MTAQPKIYVKPIRNLYQEFLTVSSRLHSLSAFHKCKPFNVKSPTERVKKSCLCIRCCNMHCLLKGINRYYVFAFASDTVYLD